MRRLPLVVLLLALGSAAVRAGDPAPAARYKPFYEITFEDGIDVTGASKVLRELRALNGEYPGLVTPQILKKIVFISPERGLENAKYCWNPDHVSTQDDGCSDEHMAIVADVPLVLSFQDKFGDFYRPGVGIKALLFHELMHGWAYTHPKDLEEYGKTASDGRRTVFERKKNRLFKPLWAIERRLEVAHKRVEMGEDTREEWKARGDGDFGQALQDDAWQRYHDQMTLDQAKAVVAHDEPKLKEVGSKIGAKVERYMSRKDAPRRGARDVHAIENEQEWFAYGAEIAFFAAKPEDFLTDKEIAWWKTIGKELAGGSR